MSKHNAELIFKLLDDYHISNEHLAPRKFRASVQHSVKYFLPFTQSLFRAIPTTTETPTKIEFRMGKLKQELNLPTLEIYSGKNSASSQATDLSYAYYILNLAYLANHTSAAVKLFMHAYKTLCKQLNNRPVHIYNAGPGLVSSLLAYYCHSHPGSRFYLIQHAVYQLCHKPYYYQIDFDSTTSWVWSNAQARIHKQQGVKHVKVLPNLKISSVKEQATVDWAARLDLVIIGELSEKYYPDYNGRFQQTMREAIGVLRQQQVAVTIGNIYFKPHPRSTNKAEWKSICATEGWEYTVKMPESNNFAVIGAFSTYLIEVIAEGIVGFQVQSEKLRALIDYDNYCDYTSMISLSVDKKATLDETVLNQAKKPYIDPDYLCIDENWIEIYRKSIFES